MRVVRQWASYDGAFFALFMMRDHRQEAYWAGLKDDAEGFQRNCFWAEYWWQMFRLRRARARLERGKNNGE